MKHSALALLLLVACDPAPAQQQPPPPPPPAKQDPKKEEPKKEEPKKEEPKPEAKGNPLLDPKHPDMNKQAPAKFLVKVETSKGEFVVEVQRDWAPKGADRFYNLVKNGFYNDLRFFRVVPNFVAQFGIHGDPKVSEKWKEANITDDPVKEGNKRGTVVFATRGKDTRTTQLFINFKDNLRLDGMGFSPFGKVIQGIEVVDQIHSGYGDQPNQGRIEAEGNGYLMREFEKLDYIKKATVQE